MNALELAMKMETDAISFYTEAAGKTKHTTGKKMFETIAQDEKRHLSMIGRVVKGLEMTQQDVSPLGNVKTVFESLKSEMMQKVEATKDEMEAFKIAMKMEKEGVEFYKKTLEQAKKEKEKLLLRTLIEEEQQHYRIFSNTHQFLSDTGNWFLWEERGIVEGG